MCSCCFHKQMHHVYGPSYYCYSSSRVSELRVFFFPFSVTKPMSREKVAHAAKFVENPSHKKKRQTFRCVMPMGAKHNKQNWKRLGRSRTLLIITTIFICLEKGKLELLRSISEFVDFARSRQKKRKAVRHISSAKVLQCSETMLKTKSKPGSERKIKTKPRKIAR